MTDSGCAPLPARKFVFVAIGNLYLDINLLGLRTNGEDYVSAGKEYRATVYEFGFGGSAANFAAQSVLLGAEVFLMGKCGEDEMGRRLLSLLALQGIDTSLVSASPDVVTCLNVGVVLDHSGENIQFVAGTANDSLNMQDFERAYSVLAGAKALYLSGVLKQRSLIRDYPLLLKALSERGVRLFLDHGRVPPGADVNDIRIVRESLQYVEGYFPNQAELLALTGEANLDDALVAALELGPGFIAAKLGPRGSRVKSRALDETVPPYKITVANSVGAGDCYNATFLWHYMLGHSLQDSAFFANIGAALKVATGCMPNCQAIEQCRAL